VLELNAVWPHVSGEAPRARKVTPATSAPPAP